MHTTIATATEIKNSFGKYLDLIQKGEQVIIMKNGKEVGRMISNVESVRFLSDQLCGILKNDTGDINGREVRVEKYESIR